MVRFKLLYKSFTNALSGLIKVFKQEQNIRIQIFFGVLAIILGFKFGISRIEWMILIITINTVILTEIINSALERLSDVVKPRVNIYVKEIKDVAAAAVVLSSITSIIIGLFLFIPYFLK